MRTADTRERLDLFGWTPAPPTAPNDAPRYPAVPGWREPETSREAAELIAASASVIRRRVLALIKDESPEGIGVHQIAQRLLLPVPTVQPRVSELKRAGFVVASGKRCKNESGASAHLWIATNQTEQQVTS
jgi:DNA-binding Lrp family transcriptional regulator